MVARGWASFVLDRRRNLISDRPNRSAAAEPPLDEAQGRQHFDNPRKYECGTYYHGEAAMLV